MARSFRFVVVLGAALVVGVAVAFAVALVGHNVLVAVYGENLAGIDDTPPMIIAVWTAYVAGAVAVLAVLVFGWRRFVRRVPRRGPE